MTHFSGARRGIDLTLRSTWRDAAHRARFIFGCLFPRTLTIEVRPEDIRSHWRGDPRRCPVALAISRATGHEAIVLVGYVEFDDLPWMRKVTPFGRPRYLQTYEHKGVSLPLEVRERIRRFDRGEPMEPFSFTLKVPR